MRRDSAGETRPRARQRADRPGRETAIGGTRNNGGRRRAGPRAELGRTSAALAAAALLLAAAAPAACAHESSAWRTETLTPERLLAPVALSFDARGNGLLAWSGSPSPAPLAQPFTGGELRLAGGSWTTTPELPFAAVEQLQLYDDGQALLIGSEAVGAAAAPLPGPDARCCGRHVAARRVRVLYATGRAGGASWAVGALDENGSTPVSATSESGDALVAWVHGRQLRVAERRGRGGFAPARVLAGPASAADPLAVALGAGGERLLAWIHGGVLYARAAPAAGAWGPRQLIARLPAPPGVAAAAKLRAAVTPSGALVLAWETAGGCAACATALRAGAAVSRDGARWRTYPVESSSVARTAPGGAAGGALAGIAPLVDSFGRTYLAWTGGLEGAPIVKLAPLTAGGIGFWTPLSDSHLGAALAGAAAGPAGALLVSWFDLRRSSTGVGPVYASLRRGERFALAVKLTGEGVEAGSGLVAFQPRSGEAVVVSGVAAAGASALQVSTDAPG